MLQSAIELFLRFHYPCSRRIKKQTVPAVMGRLSPFRSSIILGIALFILTVLTPNHAAPVQDSAISSQVDGKGCYFMNKHYSSGHEIDTNEPCLNCTCVESTLMCYLRVCPFIKPVGENCVSEMHVGDCCPKYWCPEVYPRITTEAPETEAKGCYLDGRYYMEGDRLPMNPVKPCEACYCIRNTSVCTMQTCELSIDGCFPQYKVGSCCPARYNCTDDAATTIPPGVMDAEHYEGCLHNGKMYKDGERVPSEVKCNQCYCMKHSVVCAVASCKAPAENCVPHETPDGQCCPEKYDCPEGTEIPDSATTHMITTEEEFLNLTTLYKTPSTLTTASVSASAADEDLTSGVDTESFSTTELESLYPTTKGIRRIDDADLVSTLSTIDEMMSTEDELSRTTEKTMTPVPKVTTRRPVFFPSRPIPGEGVCRHHNKTYQNGEQFESDDPCLKNCTCVNSVVKCNTMECVLEPPKAGINCKVKRIPEECCPVYVCDVPLSPPSTEETEDTQQQEILDSLSTTPKTEQQEIIPDSESTTLETEVQEEVTITHDIDQQTVVDALVTTVGTKELDQTTISDSTVSTSTTKVSITDVHSLSTETDGLSKETSDEIITKSDLSQETVSDKSTVTKMETTLAAGTVTQLIITSTTEASETDTHPESTQTDVPLTETTIVSEEVFTEPDHSQEIATGKTTVTKLETTLDAETVTPLTTLSSATEVAITSTYSTPTQSEVSHKETIVVGGEISTKPEQPETDETKFEESLPTETGTPLTTEENVTDKMTTPIDDGKTKITFEDEIATTPLKTADKDIPITDEELKTDFSTTIGKDSITKEILSTKSIPEEISTESTDTSRTEATTTVMPEADKDATKKSEATTISLDDTSDEMSSTTVTSGLELTTIFKQETTSDIIQTAVTKDKETDTTLLQTEEAYSISTEGDLKLDQSTVVDEESTTKLTALLSTESEEISTERMDTKPTIATTTVEEKKDIDVSKESDITTSLADKFDKSSSTTEATDLTSTIVKETTTVIPQTIETEEKETSATRLQTDEDAITSTEEGLKLDLSTVVEDSTAKYTILPGEISTERPDTAKPTATIVEEKDTSVTKETEITTSMSDKSDVVSSTTEAIVPESTAFESETSIDTLQTTVTEERVSDKLTTPEKEVTTFSETKFTTEGEIRKTTFELEADTTEKTTITFEPQTSTEVKEDTISMLTTKVSSDVISETFGSKDTEAVTQEIPVTQEAEKVTSISEIVPVTETETETLPTEDVKKVTLEQEIITTEFPQKGTPTPEDLLKDITRKTSYSEILTTEEIELTTKFEAPVKEFETTLKSITIKTEEAETISPVTDEEGRTSGSVTEEKRIVTEDGDVSSTEVSTTTSRITEPTIAYTATTTSETLESETKPSDVTAESEDKKSDIGDTSFDHEETEKSTSEVDTTTLTSAISMKPTLSTDKTETEATEVTKFTSPEIAETTGTVKPSTVISEVTKLLITTLKAETEKDESTETLETDKAETTTSRDQTTSISKTSPFDTTTPEQTESEMAFETSEVPDRTDDTLKKSTFGQEFTDKLTTKFEWSSPVFSTITSTSVPSHSTEELFEMTDMGTTLFDGEEKDEDRAKTTVSKDETEITPSDITSSKLSTESTTQSHAFATKEKDIVTTEKPEEKVTFTTMEETSKDLTELKTTLSETSKEETVSEITPAKTDKTDLPMDKKAVELSTLVTEAPDLVTTISVKTEVTESAAPEIEVIKEADVSTESAVPSSITTPTGETDIVTPTVVTGLTSEKTSSLQDTEVTTIAKKTDMDDKTQETFKTETTKVFSSTPSQEQTDLVTLTESITEGTTSIGPKQETSDLDKFETDSLEGVTKVISKQAQDTTTKLEEEAFKTTPSAAVSETSKVITTEKEVFSTHSFTEEITTVSKLETITPDSEILSSSPLPLTSTPKPEDLDSEISSATEITKISETTDGITDALSPVHEAEATTSETSLITEYQVSTRKSDTEKTEIMPTDKSITRVSSEIVPTVSETETTFPTSVDIETSVPSEATTEKLESDFTQSTDGVSATEMTDKTSKESDKEVDLQPEIVPTTEKVKPEEVEIATTVLEGEKTILTSTVSKLPFTTASHPSTEIPSSTVKITEEPTTMSITTSAPSDETADAMTTIKISEASFTETFDLESKTTIKFDTEKPSTVSKDTKVESQSPKDGVMTVTLSTLKDLEEKDIATSTSYDISEASDHTVSTEIITDNVFTPIKHQPDSLIREKSTIPETKTDTITSSPMSEITETISLTDTPKTSPDITQKTETASTMEFSKTESGLERSTTQDTQHETVTEKASSEIPSEVELTEPSEADEIIKDKAISVPDITTVMTAGTLDDREIKTTGPVPSDVSTKATDSSISLSETETSTTERSLESAATTEISDRTTVSVELSTGIQETEKDERLTVTDTGIQKETLPVSKEISTEVPTKMTDFTSSTKIGVTSATEEDTTATTSEEDKTDVKIAEETSKSTLTTKMFSKEATEEDKFTTETLSQESSTKDSGLVFSKQTEGLPSAVVTDSETEISTTYKYDEVSTKSTSVEIDKKVKETTSESVLTTLSTVAIPESFETESEMMVTKSEVPSESEETDMTSDRDSFEISSVSAQEKKTPVLITTTEVLAGETTTIPSKKTETEEVSTFTSEKMDATDRSKIEATTDKISTTVSSITEDQENIFLTKETTTKSSVMSETEPTVERETLSQTFGSEIITTESSPPSHSTENITFDEKLETTKIETQTPESLLVTKLVTLPEITYSTITSSGIEEISTLIPLFEERKTTLPPADSQVSTVETISLDAETSNDTLEADIATTSVPSDFTTSLTSDLDEKTEISTHIDLKRNLTESTIIVSTIDLHDLTTEHTTKVQTTLTGEDTTTAGQISITTVEGADDTDIASSTQVPQEDAKSTATFAAEPISTIKPFITEVEDHLTAITETGKETTETTPESDTVSDHLLFETTRQSESSTEESVKSSPTDIKLTTVLDKEISISESVSPEITEQPITSDIPKDFDKETTTASKEIFKESTTAEKDLTHTFSLETETVTMESEGSSTKEMITTEEMPIITSPIPELETGKVSTEKTAVTEAELIDKISLTTNEEGSTLISETEQTSEETDMKTTSTKLSSETEITEKIDTSVSTTTEKLSTQAMEITTPETKVITDFVKEFASISPVSEKELTTISEEFEDSKKTTVKSDERSTTLLSSTPASTDLHKSVTEMATTEKETVVSSEPSTLSTSKEREVTTGISLKEPTTTERVTVDVEEKVFTETSVFTEIFETTIIKKSTEKERETPAMGETAEMHVESSTVSVPAMTEKVPEIFSTVQSSEEAGTEEKESEKEISVTEDALSPESTLKFDTTSGLPEISTIGTSKTSDKTEILLTDVTSQDIPKITTVVAKDESTTGVTSTTQTDFKISDTTLPEKDLGQTEEPKVSLGIEISESSTKKETDLPRDSLETTVTETTLKDSKLETTPSLELQTSTSLTSESTTKQLLKSDTSPEISEVSTKPVTVPETVDLKTLSERTETSTALSELEDKTSTLESVTEIKRITDIKKRTTMTIDEITTSSSTDLDFSSEKEISSTTDRTEESTEFMTKSDVESTEVKASIDEFIKTSVDVTTTPPEKDITVIPLSESDKTTDESEKEVITTESTTFDLGLKVTKLSTVDKTETTSRDDDKTKSTPSSTTTEFLETITDEYDVIKETADIDKESVTATISEAEEITEKDFMSTTSKISDMVTKDELDQSTYITLKDLTSSEETVGITSLKSFETTEKKLIDLTGKTPEVYSSSKITPTDESTTDKVSGTESEVFTTKATEFAPNITEVVRGTDAETDVSYAIAHSLSTMKPAEKTEVTTEVSDADTTSVTLKVKTTELSDVSETKVVAETTEKVSTQTSISGENITVTKPTAEEEVTTLPAETESPVDDGARTEIPPRSQTTKKMPLPEEISTVASRSSGKPLISTPFVEITSPKEEITTQSEIFTVGVETTTEHTVVTEETALNNATFGVDSMIITSSTTEPSVTSFIGNDTEEETLLKRDDLTESSLKITTHPSMSVPKTDIPEDLVSDVTFPSKTTSSEMVDAETVQTVSTSVTSTKISVDTEKHATVEESLQTSPVSETTTTRIPPVSEFSSLLTEMAFDTVTEKISSLEPEEKITTMQSTDASDIYSDSELPEGFFSRRDEKIDTVTTEVSEMPTESDIFTSTVSEEFKTTLKTKEIIEDISTTELIKTETKATTSIEVDKFTAKDTEMTPEVSVTFKFTTEPVTDRIIETDITKDSEATTLGAREETTLFERKGTAISSDTSTSQATFDVTEEVFTTVQTDKTADEQDTKEIPKEVTMIETEETPEGPTPSPDIRISTASDVADDSVTKITKYMSPTTQASETTTVSVEGETEYQTKTIFTTDETEVKETRLDASETTEIEELKTSTFAASTKEHPVVTESPPSRATMVPSEVITDGTTPEKSVSTDTERKDFTSETKAFSEVETSTEVQFDILSTTLSPEIPKTEVDSTFDMKDDCMVNGASYKDGEAIITIDPCEKCHCSLGEIRCFKILCKLPKEGCKPNISSTSECCPSSYECPEEDTSIPSTTIMHSVSHKDLTTPIPISFMFSTTPKSIASTMLITKSDDLTESTEEATSEKLETILSKDMTSTQADVSPKVTEETVSEEVITDSSAVHSTPETSDLYPSSTGPSAATVTLSVMSKQDNQTTDKDVEATKAIEQEISTTLRYDLTGETATVTSSAGGEVTTTEIPTSRIYLTSTDGKEKISEVTKQTTETPTTFDTIKTTFEVTQEEKEGETTLVPGSTTTPYSTTMESNLTTAFETVSSTGIVFEDKITEKVETMLPITARESKTTEKSITEQDKMTTQMLGETTTVRVELSSDKELTGTLSDFTKEIILEKMSTSIAPKIITTEVTRPTEITTIKENLTTTTPTAMPSKLPKLDDILTSTMETRSETLSTIFTEDKGAKEVTKTDVTERKTTTEESTVSSFETTDSRVTLKDSDVKVSTESVAAVTEGVSSTKTSFVDEDATPITLSSEDVSTPERVNKTTEEELLSTLFSSPTKEPTSFDISTVTKSNLLSETTDSLVTSSLFDTKQDTLPTETVSTPDKVFGVIHETLYTEDKDKFDTTSSTLPTFSSIPEETTEFEIITEISLMNKTIPSLDKEGTERSTEKEILTSTISIPVTHTDETIRNKTTDFEEEMEKVGTTSTLSDFTDKIFTFVSTRFTDLMKGTEEFTTFTPQKEIEDISKKQTTVITTSEFSTEKADKSVTPLIPLTRRIDLEIDRTTLEGSTLQDTEITQSPLFEQTRKELVTKSKDESTSDTVGSATTDEATFKSTETPEDILTTISSIITSLKQDTVTSSSLSEKPVTSTMQDALSETAKETSSTDDEDKFRTEKSRVELTTIPDSGTSSTKARTKDADVSPTDITKEFDMETLKTVSTLKEESDVSTLEAETQPISVTSESEEEVSDYTKIPSRATRKDVRFETTPTSFTGTGEQETKATDQQKDITRIDDDQSTTKQVIATTTPYALSSTSESSTPSPITTISDKFDLPTLSTLFSILTNESTDKTDLETNETSSTPFEEKPVDVLKTTTTDEDDESSRDIEAKLTTAGQDTETATRTVTREEMSTLGEATRTTEKETFTESTKHLESTTRIDEKSTSPDEVSITGKADTISEISDTTVKEVTQAITEQTKSTSDTGEPATVSLSPKTETTEFEGDQITQKVENITEEVFTTESSKRTESIEQTKTTVSFGENITEPSEVTVKLEAETLSAVVTTTEIPKMTEAEDRIESTEQSELTPTVSEKTTLTTQLDKDVTTTESDTSPVPQITQTVRGETSKTSDIPTMTEIRDRTESTELPIPTQKIFEKTEEPTVVTRKAETASETVFTVSETPKMTEKETFTTREEKITTEPTAATITIKAETISDETSTSTEILRTAGKEITTESVEQPKLTTRMDEISSTAVQDREKTMTEAEATITAEAEDISTVTYDKKPSTESETSETSSEMSSPVSREEVNTTTDLTKGPKAIDTTPASHITTPYSTTADIETTTIQEEEDYLVDENTCIFEGRIYQSAEQIPRPDPCEFCFCFRGDIICLQQSCPPPLPNCQQTSIPGYCCPRYECPIYLASKNITQLSRRKGVNPIIIQKRIDKREIARPVVEVKGCQINGTFYEMGKTVTSASGPCLHCVCQEDGFLHCDPQRCKPQPPLMLKMNSNFFRR